jgi:hypothetical protein
MEVEVEKHDKDSHHATATAGAGTGVFDCDGGDAGVSASFLNICGGQ